MKPLKIKTILAPIDFSRNSRKGLDYAIGLARQFGAKVILLHVMEPVPYFLEAGNVAMTESFSIGALEEELANLAKFTIEPECLEGTHIRTGVAFDAIVKTAQDYDADLIVITTHGYRGLKHILLGSTAEKIVQYASCPVFVVRGDEEVSSPKTGRENKMAMVE